MKGQNSDSKGWRGILELRVSNDLSNDSLFDNQHSMGA